ncbi:MAG: aminodeoxychorismate synthase, component I, partial [Proteobacteria bacterium]|nr:aminodeoxychorismate synthase, component I [Pseudomonadota bacterium]
MQTEPNATVVLRDDTIGRWLNFSQPRRLCIARHVDEVVPVLREIEQAVNTQGLYAAGFVSYEAAPAFDPSLVVKTDRGFPLVWFGLYDAPAELSSLPAGAAPDLPELSWKPTFTARQYHA